MIRANYIVLGAVAVLGSILPALQLHADDSAASIAAGGLVARRETRIVMAKEVLRISPTKIVVDYDFRNDSDQDVTTEVAFPIPPYGNGPVQWPTDASSFSSFRLTIDQKPVRYKTEARAFLAGKEVTEILKADKIDIASFGHYDWSAQRAPEFERLPKNEQARLSKLGLFDEDPWGNWTVRLQYHWTQVFPSHATVHIRHEYKPVKGFHGIDLDTFKNVQRHIEPAGTSEEAQEERENLKLLNGFCPDPSLLRASTRSIENGDPSDGLIYP